jgi:hypothetical protein
MPKFLILTGDFSGIFNPTIKIAVMCLYNAILLTQHLTKFNLVSLSLTSVSVGGLYT